LPYKSRWDAFTWLLGRQHQMKPFSPEEIDEAVEWTQVRVRAERVRAVIARLQASLARSATPRTAT